MKAPLVICLILLSAAVTELIGAHWQTQRQSEQVMDLGRKLEKYKKAIIVYPKENEQTYQVSFVWEDEASGKKLAVARKLCKLLGVFPYYSPLIVISL